MRPMINEGDCILFLENDKKTNKVYYVYKTEDFRFDYTSMAAVATVTLGNFTQINNLEPKQIVGDGSEIQCYQIRCGIDVGMCYVELLSGMIRRTPFKQRRPTSSAPYVGYFDENDSGYYHARYEFFLRYNEVPGFAVYNRWGFSITPILGFTGRKLDLFDLDKPQQITDKIGISPSEISQMAADVRAGRRPARRLTVYGMED